ncbi:hypothetical protein SAMN04488556_3672 [Halostagnicola kamekurae]|uniref:Uncharacterized protein n=1 Tax=Halostagnicola kamekurae TaxID=619731 RepID=A0A1I6UA27_9EURY|nr:hypothetical protein SAMN04488556_3672 [Halostagnicola kamekurae]
MLALAASALGIGSVYGSEAFSGSTARRSLGIGVSDDSRSLLAIEPQDPVVGGGDRTKLFQLTNNFAGALDDISVEVENPNAVELDFHAFTTPEPLEPGESGAIRASISAGSSVTETVGIIIRASGDGESVVARRDLTISYESESNSGVSARVDDLTSIDTDDPVFYVSYDTHGSAGSVRITASDQNTHGASDTETVIGERGGTLLQPGWNAGATFDITIEAVDDGTVTEDRTLVTIADTQNPSGNDDLGLAESASLKTASIADSSSPTRDAVHFDFSYAVTPSGSFSEVGLYTLNTSGTGGVADRTRDHRSGDSISVSTNYGANTPYKLALLVFDGDGVVVDSHITTDVADGVPQNGPIGG